MTDRNRPRRSSRDRSYDVEPERRSRRNSETKFTDGENNAAKAANVNNKRKRSDSDSRGQKRAKVTDSKKDLKFSDDKSRDRRSVNSSLPGLDWCTCEGRLSDRRDTKSIFNHALPGEELIESCPESFQIRQLVEQGRLCVYAVSLSPAISSDWPRTRFSVEDKAFVFDGFYLLAHHAINVSNSCSHVHCLIWPVGADAGHQVTEMQFTHLGNECQLKLESAALHELEIAVEIADLEWSYKYLFTELLGYSDFVKWTCKYPGSLATPRTRHVHGCRRFHFYPKFVQDDAKNSILPLSDLRRAIQNQSGRNVWQLMSHESHDQLRGQLVRHEGRCYRVDHVDAQTSTLLHQVTCFTHYEPVFRRTERKGGHQLFKLTARADRGRRELRLLPDRCLTTAISADLAHVASLLPSLVYHLRLHAALQRVEHVIGVQFSDRQLLHHVIIHPSYWECIDAAAKELRDVTSRVTWWGVAPSFSEPSVAAWPVRKRRSVTHLDSEIWEQFSGNQRLEFLGDAVLEFVVSTHLFMLLSEHKAGELSTFRAGLVNNKVLCHLAQQLQLDRLVTHLYHRELIEDTKSYQSVVGDCYESLLGAIYLDQGLIAVREFFARCLFMNDDDHEALSTLWQTPPSMPQALLSTPQLSASAGYSATLQRLEALEEVTGIVFQNKLLLAAAFTHPSVGTNASLDMLNIGSNQRLEFLGDSVLQLVVSFYLFNRFPEYFEGQLSLVRTTLVNNDMLSQVALELGLHNYIRYLPGEALLADGRAHARMLADTFEAYLAAMYLDRGLVVVETFLSVVLFPRLDHVLEERAWLDSRTRLTRVVLNITKSRTTLPTYRVTGESGPPHLRVYTVTCFLADRPLGQGRGISRSAAEQEAAKNTLLRYEFSRPATDAKSRVIDVNSIMAETDAALVETSDLLTDLGEPTEDEVREIDAEM